MRPRGLGAWTLIALGCALPVLALALGWVGRPAERDCSLVRVFDGDSLLLRCQGQEVEVRLYCIDAPERDQAPWGARSRLHLRQITPQRVALRERELDRYGRTVGELYSTAPRRRSLNLEQVASGQAAVYDRFCEDPAFLRAEGEARRAGKGIWSKPGQQQTPWAFRRRTGN